MKIASSLKSLKKRDLNSKLVRRRGRVYIINKKIQSSKHVKNRMDNESHKNTWNNFTKFVLGSSSCSCISFNGYISFIK